MSPLPRALACANKHLLNRVMRRVAPHLPGFALLTHTGRRSGTSRTVPVNIFRAPGGYRIALTYGADADWVRNVLAAGGCTVLVRGRQVALTDPVLRHDPGRSWAPPVVRQILGLARVPDSLVLRAAGPDDGAGSGDGGTARR
ncbi:nitroreductase family deazaflavin-dependent oxidoreductase [Georgenia sp. TF02-10]|uniref:nitroreductase family deazaflavin-dependent oxidoreductase n=1 Tax=Georgenia sp. TF02-10 TaxID=2917725 RepID=UPI001FA7FDB1|nr:nitroreductase family deazaflavin-dependent oxidoreductase [Georgenia sp. TF02-10]UNX56090.1 nitroreductase family deazaflavin-dependent oxidoreductase [Georgenia sp. TF02-10]